MARLDNLLGVAVIGMLVSAQFSSTVDDRAADERLSPAAQQAAAQAKDRPLTTTPPDGLAPRERQLVGEALADASVDAFHRGVTVIGSLALLAGVLTMVSMQKHDWRFDAARFRFGSLTGAHHDTHLISQGIRGKEGT